MTSAVDATSGRFSLGKDLDVPLWRVRRGIEIYSATFRTPHETEVAGVPVGRHEKVLLLNASANRGETMWEPINSTLRTAFPDTWVLGLPFTAA